MQSLKRNFLRVIVILIALAIPTKIYMEYNSVSSELEEEHGNYEDCLNTANSAIDSTRTFIENLNENISYENIESIGINSLRKYEKGIKDCDIKFK